MTTVATVPVTLPRPVPWRRLAWVAWRRYRTTLNATVGVLTLLAVYLVIKGERIRSAYAAVTSCRPINSANCHFLVQRFHDNYGQSGLINVLLVFLPGLIGAFAGAPVLARELETGTFRYAWTQGVGRTRWAIAVLIPGAFGVAAIMAAFGLLITWYERPLNQSQITPRLHPTIFPITGLASAAWPLLAFALGALAGLLWRRVIPALVTAFGLWFGLALLVGNVLRMKYLSPKTTASLDYPANSSTIDVWWTKGNVRVTSAQLNSALSGVNAQITGNGNNIKVGPTPGGDDPVQYLLAHGYSQVTSYQPGSRYWTFQWIEFGWLTALAVILLGTAFWLLRRRPA
jgi:hypothetical protein